MFLKKFLLKIKSFCLFESKLVSESNILRLQNIDQDISIPVPKMDPQHRSTHKKRTDSSKQLLRGNILTKVIQYY